MDDLEALKTKWLGICGACDAGLPEYGCSHPDGDYRPVMLELVREVEQLTAELRHLRVDRFKVQLERDAMRPVVGAAEVWRDQFSKPADTKYPRMGALIRAVDAYRSDIEGPADASA